MIFVFNQERADMKHFGQYENAMANLNSKNEHPDIDCQEAELIAAEYFSTHFEQNFNSIFRSEDIVIDTGI